MPVGRTPQIGRSTRVFARVKQPESRAAARSHDVAPVPRFAQHHQPLRVADRGRSSLDVRFDDGLLVPSPSAVFDGPVFVGRPSPRDVEQGKLGDCYLLSALAAIAVARPEWLDDLIEPLDRGARVRFYDVERGRRAEVVVDGRLAVRRTGPRNKLGLPKFARGRIRGSSDRMVMWGPLVEKAYAAWKGGYESIGHGGRPSRALEELTGRRAFVVTRADGRSAMRRALVDAWDAGMPIVASSLKKSYAADLLGTGVRPSHAYAVLGVREERGELVVTVRNPWGHYEPGAVGDDAIYDDDDRVFDGVDDGIFDLTFHQFLRYFRKITTLEAD